MLTLFRLQDDRTLLYLYILFDVGISIGSKPQLRVGLDTISGFLIVLLSSKFINGLTADGGTFSILCSTYKIRSRSIRCIAWVNTDRFSYVSRQVLHSQLPVALRHETPTLYLCCVGSDSD